MDYKFLILQQRLKTNKKSIIPSSQEWDAKGICPRITWKCWQRGYRFLQPHRQTGSDILTPGLR